ncbi:MAG: hypothetical protein WCH20_15515 [Nitrospira sp.]
MAKRKTIKENPLDAIVPDRTAHRTGESAAAANAQSVDPATGRTGTPAPRSRPKVKDSAVPAPATQAAQPPSPADLTSRIQSLEKENEFIKWLAGGAILLWLLL